MTKTLRRLFLLVLFITFNSTNLTAAEKSEDEAPIDVVGTVADHDYFNFFSIKVPLPRIILLEDANGQTSLEFFASTYKAVDSGLFEDVDHVLTPSNGGHILMDFSITSHLVYFWFGMGLAIILTVMAASRYRKGVGKETEPKGALQNLFEVLFVFIRDDVARNNIPEGKADRYVPYLFTVFMGISFMNLFGLLPWAATATADITVTATLAVITFIITQFSGTKDHWQHVFWFPGVPVGVKFLMIPVEIVGLFTKPFALAIRLFANMLSGKIMIIAILGLIFIFGDLFGSVAGYGVSLFSVTLTVVLYALKVFVALLQAYIFTLLSAVFIGMAAESHEHDHDEVHAH
jgi:F-type H+-transporting ATPase subunit a